LPRVNVAKAALDGAEEQQGKEGQMSLRSAEQGRGKVRGSRAGRIALGLISTVALWVFLVPAAIAAAPQITATTASAVGTESATLEAKLNPQNLETSYHFEYGLGACPTGCAKVPVPDAKIPAGTSPVVVKATVEGLTPNTIYHFRLVARNPAVANGPDRTFLTYAPPLTGLPDARAYEQATPVDKDGGDAVGTGAQVKAAADGSGITFGSTFGIPGGEGAQALPMYLARRGDSSWSTRGLLPPASTAERAQVLGWLPNFSDVFTNATFLGAPWTEALLEQSTATGQHEALTPYVANGKYAYAGASQDGSIVLFESLAALPVAEGEPVAGASNLYAREAGKPLALVSVLNTKAETEAALPRGAFAGPYDWAFGINASGLGVGGAQGLSYVQDVHAIAANGDIYFTAAGTGQLYLRENPTQPQSALNGQGECSEAQKACTIQVSATEKTNGQGPNGSDRGGSQAAALMGASEDGSLAFFTSPEQLTDDANTGKEQPSAAISRDTLEDTDLKAEFIPGQHAVGVAVDGSHLYWANPVGGEIGRSGLDGSSPELFFVPGPTKCEIEVENDKGETELETLEAPSTPRYVAVQGEYIYWSNTGPRDGEVEEGGPINGCGTIGRAKINPESEEAEEVESEFITGAFNPEGVAANESHIYWANAATAGKAAFRAIAWAKLNGGGGASEVEQKFVSTPSETPHGVALDASHVYFTSDDGSGRSYVTRVTLEGENQESLLLAEHIQGGKAGIRGIAVEGEYVYWTQQEEGTIGRAPLSALGLGEVCDTIPGCDREFIKVEGVPTGLAADSEHLYWSINGEAPINPGNDLYRFDRDAPAGQRLSDLTVDEEGDGAEVQGVLGTSRDGSHVYFAANGVLAGGASPGDCRTAGSHGELNSIGGNCNLYLWNEGQITFLARLNAVGGKTGSDAGNWLPAPQGIYGSGGYTPRSAFASPDGQTLLFRSREKLSSYDNEGTPELYRYRVGAAKIACVSCNPAGVAPTDGPSLGSVSFADLSPRPGTAALLSRNLAGDGNRAFFESAEALSPLDTNGALECPKTGFGGGATPTCLDVYEWEAPGAGSCAEGSPSYSAQDEGCLYLISTGKSESPSFFADASESGDDAFFFTRSRLVGQDKDELQDVYDARVEGGLPSQNPPPRPNCESTEACRGPAPAPPAEATPATPNFTGPQNPKPKRGKKSNHKKHHKQKKKQKHHKQSKHKRANANGGQGR
jgi:virginiamycin B lyase